MNMNNDWQALFDQEIQKPYLQHLRYALAKEYKMYNVYPKKEDIFAAFQNTALKDTKVVIIGQDPYHGPGQAHGLAFSVNPNCKIPPSLQNIYKELSMEYQKPINRTGDLHDWARQGVLLLNPILTVREHAPLSHQKMGWQNFTSEALKWLDQSNQPIVFMLWGNKARELKQFLHNPNHLVLESAHPSPFSANRGFFGNNHFKKANDFLESHGLKGIDWTLDNINRKDM